MRGRSMSYEHDMSVRHTLLLKPNPGLPNSKWMMSSAKGACRLTSIG